MGTNKYYIPKIEEFHVGFEYEAESTCYPDKNNWHAEVFYMNPSHLQIVNRNTIFDKKVRVKYLDKEDIESLGWEQIKYDTYKYKGTSIHLEFNPEYKTIIYSTRLGHWLFSGEIKNKSELKKLMLQLNILKDEK